MNRYGRLVLGVILALGVGTAVLALAASRLGPAVDSFSTAKVLDGTLVNTQIGITFTEPMKAASVTTNFSIAPRVKGDFVWSGNQMLFVPRKNLAYARTYAVTIGTGAEDMSGKHLNHRYTTTFTTQAQHLLYLGTSGARRHRLVLASVSGRSQTVGQGGVTGFSVSMDRSLAVYVRRGSPTERPDEIWILSLADNSSQRLYRRPDWSLSQPHFSPDGSQIVFLASHIRICRGSYDGCYLDTTTPLIYFLDVHSGKVRPFSSTTDVPITNFIDFSPDNRIAYTDLGSALTLADPNGSHVTHVPNQGNSLLFQGFDPTGDKAAFVGQTPSSTGGDIVVYWSKQSGAGYVDVSHGVYDSSEPAFSTSGNLVSYSAYRGEKGIEPIYGISVYDFGTKRTVHLTSPRNATDWGSAWSPDDRYIAFVRSAPKETMYLGSGHIWVMRSDGSHARSLDGSGTSISWVL